MMKLTIKSSLLFILFLSILASCGESNPSNDQASQGTDNNEGWWIEGYVSDVNEQSVLLETESTGLVFFSGVQGAEVGDYIKMKVEAIMESYPGQAHVLDYEIEEPELPETMNVDAKQAIQEAYLLVLEQLDMEAVSEELHYVTVRDVVFNSEHQSWQMIFFSNESGELTIDIPNK
ncbi:hypothetical protein BTS2_3542 [Bacillus sp. TS-2]|nr:hypothetical protein BTS2_3542 [Bacillus sp. TS-2]